MKNYFLKKQKKIVFNHIPKCGGTSISYGIAFTYFPLHIIWNGRKAFNASLDSGAATSVSQKRPVEKYKFRRDLLTYYLYKENTPYIYGHYPTTNEICDEFENRWSFVTLLRDPVDRYYSEYYWNRYNTGGYRKIDIDIEQWIESEEGKSCARSFVNYFVETEKTTGMASQQEVAAAIETLEKFSVVGILEELEKFKSDLKKSFGRKPIFPHMRKSPKKNEKKLPDKNSYVHKKIFELCAADREIYLRIREKYGRQ